jgi:hypothetical protein
VFFLKSLFFAQVAGYSPKSVAAAAQKRQKTPLFYLFWINIRRNGRLFVCFFVPVLSFFNRFSGGV